jgi:hypothetical protein
LLLLEQFCDRQIKMTFRMWNTIENIITPTNKQTNKYNKSGIYQTEFLACPLKYIGKTYRTFNTRLKNIYKQFGIIKPHIKHKT